MPNDITMEQNNEYKTEGRCSGRCNEDHYNRGKFPYREHKHNNKKNRFNAVF